MTNEMNSPVVQAALQAEKRMTTVENKLDTIQSTLNQLVERVGIQNGRVAANDLRLHDLDKHVRDREELIDKPRWGRFESVADQVAKLWEDRALIAGMGTARERFWIELKRRLDIIAVVAAIVGGPALLELAGRIVQ